MRFSIVIALLAAAAACRAQTAVSSRNLLTNRDVVTLADAGFGEEFIIETIAASRTEFDTSADALAELKKHGVKDDIIRAMRDARPSGNGPAKPEVADSGQPPAIRVFVELSQNSSLIPQSHSQTAEIVATFARNCPALTVTSRKDAAAFLVVLDRTSKKLLHPATTRMVVIDRAGDKVYGSQRALGQAVRGFCASAQNLAAAKGEESLPGSRFSAR
jgi:hypothetical protein